MSRSLRRSLSLCLAALVFYAYSPRAIVAHNAAGSGHVGDLSTFGRVLLDGAEAASGVTFFSGSEVRTGEESRAVLGLGSYGRAEVLPQSTLQVGFGDEGVSAALGAGGVRLSKPEGVPAAVTFGGGSVLAEREGAAVFTVSRDAGRTTVETQSGKVRLKLNGKEVVVASGERYSEGQDAQDAGNHLSGKKKAGIILAVGGGIALLLIILAAVGDDDEDIIISPSR